MSKNYFELQEKYGLTDPSDPSEFSEELVNPQQEQIFDRERGKKPAEQEKEKN